MPEKAPPQKSQTFDELEQELDKDALSPEVMAVESQPNSPVMPPGPRERSPGALVAPKTKVPEPPAINEADLRAAASAIDEESEDEAVHKDMPLTGNSFHAGNAARSNRPRFWRRKKFWIVGICGFILILLLVWLIRPTRLLLVNALGLRADVSIATVTLPDAGQQSSLIKKVRVDIDGAMWESDDHGLLTAKVPYGEAVLTAQKPGYEQAAKTVFVDFDPFFYLLGGRQADETARQMNLQLKVVGLPLKFQAKDWLSDEPISSATFAVGEVVAKSDDRGVVNLTVPATDAKKIPVKTMFGGTYVDKEFDVPLDGSQPGITFVPEGKDYFVSKRGGGLAVYRSDLDGSHVTEIVPVSPHETAAMAIAISPSGKYGLLASTRDGTRDAQGTLLQKLYIVDLANKKLTPVDQAQWFSFADWSEDTLVYTAGERKTDAPANTQRLASIDAAAGTRADLSTASEFGAVRVAVKNVIYQVSAAQGDSAAARNPELKTVAYRGGPEKSLGYKVQQLTQTDFDTFVYQLGDGTWSGYNANTSQAKTVSAPASPNRVFGATATADGQHRVVVDTNDGTPALIIKNTGSGQEKQVYRAAGVRGPVRLVGDALLFRLADGTQTADYVVSIKGGTAKKVTDVTASTAGRQSAGALSLF